MNRVVADVYETLAGSEAKAHDLYIELPAATRADQLIEFAERLRHLPNPESLLTRATRIHYSSEIRVTPPV